MLLQQGQADGHAEFPGKLREGIDEIAVGTDRFGGPLLHRPVIDGVSVAPHLREQRDVGAERSRPAAVLEPFLEVLL